MADLDPRLQQAAAEYLEHRSAQDRAARRSGPALTIVFLLVVAAAIGVIAWLAMTK